MRIATEILSGRKNANIRLENLSDNLLNLQQDNDEFYDTAHAWLSAECKEIMAYKKLKAEHKEKLMSGSLICGQYKLIGHDRLQLFLYVKNVENARSSNRLRNANVFDTLPHITIENRFFGSSVSIAFAGSVEAGLHFSSAISEGDPKFFERYLSITFFDDFGAKEIVLMSSLKDLMPRIEDRLSPPSERMLSLNKLSNFIQVELEDCQLPEDILRCGFATMIDCPVFYIDFPNGLSDQKSTTYDKNIIVGGARYLTQIISSEKKYSMIFKYIIYLWIRLEKSYG